MENIVKTVGLDLAKDTFHVFCADAEGNVVQSKALRRNRVLPFFEELGTSCMVAMETCTGANWWCRQLRDLGYDARLIPAAYVKPYVKSQKNDALDAEAICEAAQRPSMRFAPVKSEEASAVLTAHRTRRHLMKQRTMNVNHLRSACAEFGVVRERRSTGFEQLAVHLRQEGDGLPPALLESQRRVLDVIERLEESIRELHAWIAAWHKGHEESVRLEGIPGVGVLSASYLAATLGDGSAYRNGRQFAASLGLVPRQNSTGGKQRLGGITKRGDPLLRGLLYEGAFALLSSRLRNGGRDFPITARFVAEKSFPVVAVAWANRNARTAWSMIRHGTEYEAKSKVK